ncbi:ribosome-binding factor A [Thioalkalivibrio sp. K90mix]|jgi:ribosome-binding factor A|uniref:30S ribosome-binding factor RbfA n=1 Tax=unclassified Thioalkalivibrio TaxID=2621013 RepID=UPI000195A971|nr:MULTISPECIES: 30S ribosome-binding factor RbfA [unclassified Thioalkalivibrio]ADC71241.1 ribosome-binding factor A [Thioalkalivibrio sp. K90mix]
MPGNRDFHRSDRVGDQIQRELAELIRLEVKDPRVGMITLADVEVSRDLAHAKVFFTQLGGEEKGREAQQGLNHAAGFLRRALGQRMRLRSVPQLRFVYDDTPERGARMSSLIDQALAEDRAHHADPDGSDSGDQGESEDPKDPGREA